MSKEIIKCPMDVAWICLNLKQGNFIQCEFTALINGTCPSFPFLISLADPEVPEHSVLFLLP